MNIHKKIPSFKFNSEENKWEIQPELTHKIPTPPSIKIINLNVLFDKWKGVDYKHHVTRPFDRYNAQFKTMQKLQADFIVLNEVTPTFIALITKEEWVQNQYIISDVDGSTVSKFGNIILSKYQISELHLKHLSQLKRPIACAKIAFDNRDLVIAASHFSAYKEKHERRQVQIKELTAYLEQFYVNADKLILGDVNFHTEAEIPPANYIDIWKKLNPSIAGNTFDGSINLMLHEMWPLAWMYGIKSPTQMRLDRVFAQLTKWNPDKMELCFNTPIYQAKKRSNFFKGIPSAAFDRFGINILRNPKHYLFPSDHFGLVTTFQSK